MSDFNQFLQQFEVPPPVCLPLLPDAPQPCKRLRFLSLFETARTIATGLVRALTIVYVVVFWSIAATLLAAVFILGILEVLR